ncbi:hypothetical protein S83_036194 [Arachis hypogaea]
MSKERATSALGCLWKVLGMRLTSLSMGGCQLINVCPMVLRYKKQVVELQRVLRMSVSDCVAELEKENAELKQRLGFYNAMFRLSLEENMFNDLTMIQEHVLSDKDVTKTILKNHNDQLRTISELLEDHGKAIQVLIMLVNTANDNKPRKKNLAGRKSLCGCMHPPGKQLVKRTMYSSSNRKAAAMTNKHSSHCRPATGAEAKLTSLKKLTFEDLDSSASLGFDVRQTDPETLFTYHSHHGHHAAEDMPLCLNVSFPPPTGMHFVSKELVVVAYIFSSDLDMREVLLEDENARGD